MIKKNFKESAIFTGYITGIFKFCPKLSFCPPISVYLISFSVQHKGVLSHNRKIPRRISKNFTKVPPYFQLKKGLLSLCMLIKYL